jgi:hypothetical protein
MQVDDIDDGALLAPPEDLFAPSVTTMLGSRQTPVDFNTAEGFLTLLKDLEEKKEKEHVAIDQLMTYCPAFT